MLKKAHFIGYSRESSFCNDLRKTRLPALRIAVYRKKVGIPLTPDEVSHSMFETLLHQGDNFTNFSLVIG